MRPAAILLLGVALWAQTPLEITGRVTEPGTQLAVFDATVVISRMEAREPGLTDAHIKIAELHTDAQGNFRYKVPLAGTYMVAVQKAGFSSSMASILRGGGASQVNVVVDAANPRREVQFVLGRQGSIRGRVIDADTNEPVAGLRILASVYSASTGSVTLFPGGTARTDKEGVFNATTTPGRYVVEIRPQLDAKERMLQRFTDEDADATDRGYRTAYFPGGPSLASVVPVVLPSGSIADVGTIRIRQETFFRARVKTGGECTSGQMVVIQDVLIKGNNTSSVGLGGVPCGSEVLLRYLESGRHIFNGTLEDDRLGGSVPVEITSGNVNAFIPLARGGDIAGKIIAAEGSEKLPDLSRVRLQWITRPFSGDVKTTSSDSAGAFRVGNVRSGRKQLTVTGLDPRFYVKQIRVNRLAAPGGLFDLASDAAIEVELDSHADDQRDCEFPGQAGAAGGRLLDPLAAASGGRSDTRSALRGGRHGGVPNFGPQPRRVPHLRRRADGPRTRGRAFGLAQLGDYGGESRPHARSCAEHPSKNE